MKPANALLVVLLSAATASVCAAQANGVPASVTSFGFGGSRNAAPGTPASVTSVGPLGYGRGSGTQCCATRFVGPGFVAPVGDHHRRGPGNGPGNGYGNSSNYGFYGGYVPVYSYGGYYPGYSPVIVAQEETSNGGDDNEEAGPTVFEHRAARRPSVDEAYDRGYEEGRAAAEEDQPHRDHLRKAPEPAADRRDPKDEDKDAKSDSKPEARPAPAIEVKTVLVYKDGKKEEVANYAIVGDQLFDFTNGRRKIAISDLDVSATTKANDERGVDFQLPAVRAKK